MTIPIERTRAVLDMVEVVLKLHPYLHGSSPNALVPRDLLLELVGKLRHYPTKYDLHVAAERCPDVFADFVDIDY